MSSQQPDQSAVGQFLSKVPSPEARRCVIDYITKSKQLFTKFERLKSGGARAYGDVIATIPSPTPERLASFHRVIAGINTQYEQVKDTFKNELARQDANNRPLRSAQLIKFQQKAMAIEMVALYNRLRASFVLTRSPQIRQLLVDVVYKFARVFSAIYLKQLQIMSNFRIMLIENGIIVVGLLSESIKLLVTTDSRWESIYLNFMTDEFASNVGYSDIW